MTRVLIVEDQSMPRTLFEMYVNQSESYTLAAQSAMPIWRIIIAKIQMLI